MSRKIMQPYLLFLPLLIIWGVLIQKLSISWEAVEQYSFGWTVPFICIGMLWSRWQTAKAAPECNCGPVSANNQQMMINTSFIIIISILALFYLATRLVQSELNITRIVDWLLAGEAVGITLIMIYFASGFFGVKQYAFPICFIMVAVPWPTFMENMIIQSLAQLNTVISVEVVGILGIPALRHGTIVEIGSGTVGVSDACSGIRSFQSTIMLALFLGEMFRLNVARRVFLFVSGLILSFFFNVCRTSFLIWIASKNGIGAVSIWHDSAGLSILAACLVCLYLMGFLLKKRMGRTDNRTKIKAESEKLKAEIIPDGGGETQRKAESGKLTAEIMLDGGDKTQRKVESENLKAEIFPDRKNETIETQKTDGGTADPISAFSFQLSTFKKLSVFLLIWLIIVESATFGWIKYRVAQAASNPEWLVNWPTNNPSFKFLTVEKRTKEYLACDRIQQAAWSDPDEIKWSVFLIEWLPSRLGRLLASTHVPENCLKNIGYDLLSTPERVTLKVKDLNLPFKRYVFKSGNTLMHVFFCNWEAKESSVEGQAGHDLLRGGSSGKGKFGHQVLEVAVSGFPDLDKAQEAVVAQLEKLIVVKAATDR